MILRQSMRVMTSNALDTLICSQRKTRLFIHRAPFSTSNTHDAEVPYEEESIKKLGWKTKLLVAVGLTYVGCNIFPLMGDSLVRQSVALVHAKDPFFKRSGAYRLSVIATNDIKRRCIVEAGGVIELVQMLESASDDKTRLEAIKALTSLSPCDLAVEALDGTGVEEFIRELAIKTSDADIQRHSSGLLESLDNWKASRNQ